MAVIEFWIQLEVRDWDTQPKGVNRMDATSGIQPDVIKNALVYRRYTANWAAPDDRKVNPWDLNEPEPNWGYDPRAGPGVLRGRRHRDPLPQQRHTVEPPPRDCRSGKAHYGQVQLRSAPIASTRTGWCSRPSTTGPTRSPAPT